MSLAEVCQHDGVLYETRSTGAYVEGTVVSDEAAVQRFKCCLFLPLGEEDQTSPRGGRQVKRPTLLFLPFDVDGAPVSLGPKDQVGIVAPELNVMAGLPADEEVRWQVQGGSQPFGRPGTPIVGSQATLQRVED